MDNADKRMVKLTLTSKHILPDNRTNAITQSFFSNKRDMFKEEKHANPEDYPEEMYATVQDMLDRDAGLSETEIYNAGEDESDESENMSDEERQMFEEIWQKLQEIQPEDEDDVYVYRTIGELRRRTEGGREIIEISYIEGESMDETESVIVYDPARPNSVSIYRTGSVLNSIVCEEGVRHISVYQTPIMAFEMAVYTKKCRGSFDFECGGSMELDYAVEMRGADKQRTIMTVDAVVL